MRPCLALFAAACVLTTVACDPPPDPPTDAGVDAGARVDAGPPVIVRSDEREACAAQNPLRNPYFGDLHAHTAVSFDANAYGVRTRPRDAYRFAQGEAIDLPPYDASGAATRSVTIDRPLDFAAVTDHAEFFAEIDICSDPESPGYDSSTCRGYRAGDSSLPDYGELAVLLITPGRRATVCRANPALCDARLRSVWDEIQDAAEEFQDRSSSCDFTTFVAWEWTGSEGGTNLHRNILFRGRSVPRVPTSYLDAPSPEALFERLEATCLETGTPCDVLSIPHNGNLGGGQMFAPMAEDGSPLSREQSERRARLEPLVEIYQHKGASECVSGLDDPLASEDELCGFEVFHPVYCDENDEPEGCVEVCAPGGGIGFLGDCVGPADFARGMLRTGIAERARTGANPFEVGFIGSTDTHISAPGLVTEEAWPGHAGENEDEPAEQLQLPFQAALVRGRTASPGGLAVIWAEENSRESLFDAMRRRETYATSGPRIVLRFFGGFGLADDLCGRADAVEAGYADGVPMGSVLAGPAAGAPVFFVDALRDALGAPLQRIQIVKGWVEGDATREQVFEIAGDPDNGASVDRATCAPSGGGEDALCGVWTDPDFDPAVPAFWYARVIEDPTCRWSQYACNAAGVDCASLPNDDPLAACCDESIAHTLQERAWSSPIFYVP